MRIELPIPTITRLCLIYQLCCEQLSQGIESMSSTQMGKQLAIPAHSIRKDLNCLGEVGNAGSGYDLARLRECLAETLGLTCPRKACIVGLGRLGSAILAYEQFTPDGFRIVAGFDSNINRIETLHTDIPVFPAYEIADIIPRDSIELAMLTVPGPAAQDVADRLIEAGIKGIVNFAPVVIKPSTEDVEVRNINVVHELRILSALLTQKTAVK